MVFLQCVEGFEPQPLSIPAASVPRYFCVKPKIKKNLISSLQFIQFISDG